jgi:TetR/AcrR family transcriptional repressor of lmrAB and yxaGH operons
MTPPAQTGTRGRIVDAGAALFSRGGYAGTGIKAILNASDAPFGSLYHFFPGGKEELGAVALRSSGEMYLQLVHAFFPEGVDVVAATRDFFAGAAETLRATDYADACPIATVALEIASTREPMRLAAADAFESWLAALELRYTEAGLVPEVARDVAVELFCAIEGAFLLCRVTRSTDPMDIAGRAAAERVSSALAASG